MPEEIFEEKYKGKFVIDRKLFISDIWNKPDYFIRLWVWLIGRVNWKTLKREGKTYRRGEIFTNYKEIIDENKYLIGYRREKRTKNDIYYFLDFMKRTGRIETHKSTRGIWIKVLKYDLFQFSHERHTNDIRTGLRGKQRLSTKQTQEEARGKQRGKHSRDTPVILKENKENKDNKYIYNNSFSPQLNSLTKEESNILESVVKYFREAVSRERGFSPALDERNLEAVLTQVRNGYSVEELKKIIDFFLKQEKSKKFPTLSAALSVHTLNLWAQEKETLNNSSLYA